MMRVLADFHHHDLWESLSILFEDRLGWQLFRPIGMEWFDQEYWNFERTWHGDAVARQYLTPWGDDIPGAAWSLRPDRSHPGRQHRLVTVEQARALGLDLVIASVDHNHEGLHRFAHENGARFGIHLGNVRWDATQDRWDLADLALVATALPFTPPVPWTTVRQEFSLADFHPGPPPRGERFVVSSFVNCFAENAPAYAHFRGTAGLAPEHDWRVYGAYGSAEVDEYAAGNIGVCADVAAAMRASDVIWHTKQWSDGFGHVIHNAFAVGRPVLGMADYYRDQLAGPLWVEGVTSFDIRNLSPDATLALIRRLHDDEEMHHRMCAAAAARFREVVDFDAEADGVRALLARVLP
jgi:hypothetical protein